MVIINLVKGQAGLVDLVVLCLPHTVAKPPLPADGDIGDISPLLPVVVYFFTIDILFSAENVKFWPILAILL